MNSTTKSIQSHDLSKVAVLFLASLLGLCACSGPEKREQGPEEKQEQVASTNELESAGSDPKTPQREASARPRPDLRTQERLALSAHYTKTGEEKYRALRYREAREDFGKALQANPDNEKARRLYEMSGTFTHETREQFHSSAERLKNERAVRIQQARIEIRRLYEAGLKLQKAKKYDLAIRNFEQVLERIRWNPYDIDSGAFEDKARRQLILSRSERRIADIRRREERETRALQAARAEERARLASKRQKTKILLKRAKDQIRLRQFAKAEETLAQVLRQDRRNTEALRLREMAVRNRHRSRRASIAERDREALRSNDENNREVGVPYMGGN